MKKNNHVGRPTKQEMLTKKYSKRNKIIFIILGIIILLGGIYLFLNRDFIDFSSLLGNSTSFSNLDLSSDDNYERIFRYTPGPYNALQGSTATGEKIYFSVSSTKSNVDKETKVYTYDIKSKSVALNGMSDYYSSSDMASYKINDITTKEGRNYYVAYSTQEKKPISHVVLNMNKTIRKADYTNGLDNLYFVGIAYSNNYKKFYSLYGVKDQLRVYTHSIDADWNGTTANISNGTYYVLDSKISISNTVSQGIAIRGYFLYCATQNKNTGINYINIYDLRTGKAKQENNPIKLVRRIKLGTTNNRYELESLFFASKKLYLGYNNSSFNRISFYTLDMSNANINSKLDISSSETGKVKIIGNALDNKKYGILYYSFCESKNTDECKWKHIKNKNGNYLVLNKVKMTKTIIKKGNSTWYFHVRDIFGNSFSSKALTINVK